MDHSLHEYLSEARLYLDQRRAISSAKLDSRSVANSQDAVLSAEIATGTQYFHDTQRYNDRQPWVRLFSEMIRRKKCRCVFYKRNLNAPRSVIGRENKGLSPSYRAS